MEIKAKKTKTVKKIIIGVFIALLVGGTSPWWWDKYIDPEKKPLSETPAHTLSLLEKVSGSYSLLTWQAKDVADRPQMTPAKGTLVINKSGKANWEIQLKNPNKRFTAKNGGDMIAVHKSSGMVVISSKQIEVGHAQSQFPNGLPRELLAKDPATGKKLVLFTKSVSNAFGSRQEGFSFHLDEGNQRKILQWSNRMGILTWQLDKTN